MEFRKPTGGGPYTLQDLVDTASRTAERELAETGEITATLATADPVGKLTVFVLPALSDEQLRALITVYCGAFETVMYAVSCRMRAAPDTPGAQPSEALVITACSRTATLIHIRDIVPGKKPSLGRPEQHTEGGGALVGLIPKHTVLPLRRAFLQQVWDLNFAPVLARPENQVHIDESIRRN